MIAAAAHGPSPLWYATRGAGAVTLVLLTASVALGIGQVRMWRPAGLPRFTVAAVHRTVSLFALVFLALHVVTVVVDPFPPIGVLNAVVPFTTSYRSLWLGLGTIACDLMLALVITSLVRMRMGYRYWRGIHWLAYAAWPVALLHGFGAGSDAKATWMLVLTAACVAAVLAAVGSRLAAPEVPGQVRTAGAAGLLIAVVGLIAFVAQGPLAKGWSRRAGTPASVLAAFSPHTAVRVAAGGSTASATPAPTDPLVKPFSASVDGSVHNGMSSDGVGVVDLAMNLRGGPAGRLRIRLGGTPLPDGGLHMDRSAVTFGPPSDPGRYQGRINYLQGTRLRALVGGAGRAIRLTLDISLGADTVTGQLQGIPIVGSVR